MHVLWIEMVISFTCLIACDWYLSYSLSSVLFPYRVFFPLFTVLSQLSRVLPRHVSSLYDGSSLHRTGGCLSLAAWWQSSSNASQLANSRDRHKRNRFSQQDVSLKHTKAQGSFSSARGPPLHSSDLYSALLFLYLVLFWSWLQRLHARVPTWWIVSEGFDSEEFGLGEICSYHVIWCCFSALSPRDICRPGLVWETGVWLILRWSLCWCRITSMREWFGAAILAL